MKRHFKKIICILSALLISAELFSASAVFADSPTDEILFYEITADVQDDASVKLHYHLDWKVLESDGIGPVDWVSIGIPNGQTNEITADSSNIKSISMDSGSGNTVRIDFDQAYYEGSTISFDFTVNTDYMYQMNGLQDGYSVYYFTPGWFDSIDVDKLIIKWSDAKASSWTGGALQKDGYLTWETKLKAGDTLSIEVSYPNDAFSFTESTNNNNYYYDDYNDGYYDSGSGGFAFLFSLAPVILFIAVFIIIKIATQKQYESESGFANGETKTKVTHTKVVYYDSCPGCGAPREEGKENCEFCGRSLIESEELIKEEEVPDEDKEALKYKDKGLFHYGTDPNTFVRVNVVHVPIITPGISRGIGSGPRNIGGGGRSGGCAHSSCACACVSCACACACACAGGGRAGCTTKDFFSSKLKLKQIERKKK